MPTAWINQPRALVRLTHRRLEVFAHPPDEGDEAPLHELAPDTITEQDRGGRILMRQIPLRDIDQLILEESVGLTAYARSEILKANIPISILSRHGHFLGGFLPATLAHGRWRLRQYQATLDQEFTLVTSRKLILAKLYNHRRLLQRIAAGRKTDLSQPIGRLQALMKRLNRCTAVDEIRGIEGIATSIFFNVWADLLPTSFPFERRSRRPPHNPVNACLSFIATLLYQETVGQLHAHGLDPALGCLHLPNDNRWSLALDLIEPFRPVVSEALTLDLFSRNILDHENFEPVNGGIYLNPKGRGKLILQYERRMEREFISEHLGHRTTLRRLIERQATDYKRSLDHLDHFQPFRMN